MAKTARASGSYFPPQVRRVDVPKGDSATETPPLGIPTVADRIAQEVVKRYLEPILEPIFHRDPYGYRPGRSAIDAVRTARRRCWRYNWTLDIDAKGYFDSIDWELLLKVAKMSADIPEDIVWPLNAYLGELPGYDPSVPFDKQRGDEPSTQHGFAQFYFTATFTQLAVSLGHILKVENGDIDMRDILLNRRILVVNLPALETSDATLAALGKLVVAGLRGMMAQLLGA